MTINSPKFSQKLVLIGYGYWGQRLSNIIKELGFTIEFVISNRYPKGIYHGIQFQPYDALHTLDKNHAAFICTGPPKHHKILNTLSKDVLCFVEKPFFTNHKRQSDYKAFIYVNYQWLSYSIITKEIVKHIKNIRSDMKLKISLVSGNSRKRKFNLIYDFMPHLISIIYRIFGFDIKVTVLKAKILKPNLFEGILDIETKSKNHSVAITFGFTNSSNLKLTTSNRLNDAYYETNIAPDKKTFDNNKTKTKKISISNIELGPVQESIQRFLFAGQNCHSLPETNFAIHRQILNLSKMFENFLFS